ncbi:MAG TPA: hypothetical protein VF420_06595 [Casimicrobiaceae bacterium]
MKFYQTLAGITVALAWAVAGAQTGMPNSSGTDSQGQAQQAEPKNATESQPDKASVPANSDANSTQAGTTTAHKMSGKTSAKKAHVAHHAKHSTQSKKSAKSTKTAHSTDYAAKTKKADRANPPEQAFTKDERDYRAALRQCAGEREQSARDSCLDGAIEQFRRNG